MTPAATPVTAPLVSCSAISTPRWSLAQDLAHWERAGWRAVGLSAVKLEAAGWERGVAEVARRDLAVTNIIGVGTARLDDRSGWPVVRDRWRRAIDAAARLRAGCVVITTGSPGRLTYGAAADAFAELVGGVAPAAEAAGVSLALEHTNSLRTDVSFVHRLADALDLARPLGLGVCVELTACAYERDLEATFAAGARHVRLVQVSDLRLGTLRTPDRLVPGDGDLPLQRLLGALLAAGSTGPFDLELIGPAIEAEGYEPALRRAARWLAGCLTELGAPPEPGLTPT
jgi:sugar phosphate isomerase/epimerase